MLSPLSPSQTNQFRCLARVLALAHVCAERDWSEQAMKMAVTVAGDFACYCFETSPYIADSDIYAAGLRGFYANAHISVVEMGKHLGLHDWMGLALFYNDFAYSVLMGDNGLFSPNVNTSQSAPVRRGSGAGKISKHASLREGLNLHCLLVCSELVNRWSFSATSSFWTILRQLETDFLDRRHGVDPSVATARTASEDLAKIDRFLRTCLVDASLYMVDLGDRVKLSQPVLHAAFDILRSAILLRPYLLRGRHMHQIVQCSLMAASVLFSSPENRTDFAKLAQGAMFMQTTRESEKIYSRFVLKTVLLSTAGADVLFSDGSAALALPGEHQPDSELTGSIQEFYEKEFVSEMRQVLGNLHRTKNPKEAASLGPFPEKFSPDPSVSPLSYISICSAMAVAMQTAFGVSNAERRTLPCSQFPKALQFASPLGVLPCLVPPIETDKKKAGGHRKDRLFRWLPDTTIVARENGVYSVIHSGEN